MTTRAEAIKEIRGITRKPRQPPSEPQPVDPRWLAHCATAREINRLAAAEVEALKSRKFESAHPVKYVAHMSEELPDDASPEVKALREELNLLTGIFYVLGEAGFKAKEAENAAKLMRFADGLVTKAQDALNSRLASEELGKSVVMEGSKLSLAKPEEASH